MTKLTKTGVYSLCALFSILLFLITFWGAAFQDSTPYWIESIGYFLLTYLCIDEFTKKRNDVNPWIMGLSVIGGLLVFQIAVRAFDFWGSIGSIMIVVASILSIILAVFCFKNKSAYTFILSYIILCLFNSFVAEMWHNYWSSLH